jgi:membrane-bound lytic murein transglycosylase C
MRRKDKIRRYGLRQIRPMRMRPIKTYKTKSFWAKSNPLAKSQAKPKPIAKPRPTLAANPPPRKAVSRVAGVSAPPLSSDANGLREPVLKYARRFRVKPSLILAVIKNESDFDPRAVSAKGAHGLMQLVPESGGREAMSFLNGREITPSAAYLSRPGANIELGTTYLHILQNRYFGAIENRLSRRHAVIAAYNAGPSRVARAITGTTDLAAAIRQINRMTPAQLYRRLMKRLPHAETRVYLARVTRDMGRFTALDRYS